MTHTITVTKLPDDVNDDVEFEIGGTHGYDCETMRYCERKTCKDRDHDGEFNAHGKVHYPGEYGWLVYPAKPKCGLDFCDDIHFAVENFNKLGTFHLDIDFDGDYWSAQPYSSEVTGVNA